MEVVGTTAGLLALAGLFSTTVDCFERVQIGRAFERDFETVSLKLASASLKLSRWGQAVGFGNSDSTTGPKIDYPQTDIDLAKNLLNQINVLFADAEDDSKKFEKRSKASELVVLSTTTAVTPSMGSMLEKMRSLSMSRRGKDRLRLKAKWAIYKRGQFTDLVEGIIELVDNLVTLFPEASFAQADCCVSDAREILDSDIDEKDVLKIRAVAEDTDKDLAAAITRVLDETYESRQATNTNQTTFYGNNNQGVQSNIIYGGVNMGTRK